MQQISRKILLTVSLFLLLLSPAWSTDSEEERLYSEAFQLIESFNGGRDSLSRAAELTADLLKRNPESAPGLLNAARLTLLRGYISYDNFDQGAVFKAQQLVNRALKNSPDFADGQILGAYAFIVDNSPKGMRQAKQMAARGAELAPDSPRVDLLYARIAEAEKDWDEVLRRANRVLAKADDPNLDRMGHEYLVDIYRHRKQYDLAEKSFRTILELDPGSPWALVNFASFLNARGRYDEAIEYGEKALTIMDFGMAHNALGKAYYQIAYDLQWKEKRPEEAKKYFLLAIRHNPGNSNAHYGLGMACYNTGHRDKNHADLKVAEEALSQALRLDPNHKQAREQLDKLNKLLEWLKKRGEKYTGTNLTFLGGLELVLFCSI
jgi:tetratricopeptide (TPR) repeat protein